MQRRNEPSEPLRTWWRVIKYPLFWATWWLHRFIGQLVDNSWLAGCSLYKIVYRVWNRIPNIGLSSVASKAVCFNDNNKESRVGVLYIIDAASQRIKLGTVYASGAVQSIKNLLNSTSFRIYYDEDSAAYKLKERTCKSFLNIASILKQNVVSIGSILKQNLAAAGSKVYIVTKEKTSKGVQVTVDVVKKGSNVAVQKVKRVSNVTAQNVKRVYFVTIDKAKQIGNVNFTEKFKNATNYFKNVIGPSATALKVSLSSSMHLIYWQMASVPTWVYIFMLLSLLFLAYFAYEVLTTYNLELYFRSLAPIEKIREGCKPFMLENVTLKEIMGKLREQINLGLNPSTRNKSSVKCFTTYVQDLPTGKEKGKFLALDLGGTNFRILMIKLDGRHYEMQSKSYTLPQALMTGPGSELFNHIASCLENFTKEHKISNETLPLGFTFSFPVEQVGLEKGILISWTKGFNCEGVIGKDVVTLLKEAIEAKMHTKINIVAVLNDTTGTLMSCAWKNHNCKIGLILGTGTNACYVEKIENIPGFNGNLSKPNVIINTEWGAFGDHGELEFISTSYDQVVDKNSVNPGKQRHEKMISGMYLGELVRLLVVKFTQEKILFEGKTSELLLTSQKFPTEYISDIESDKRGSFKNCRNVLEKLNIRDASDQDCANIRYICECVTRRAAYLASAGLATLINKMQIPSLTIGVDGTLYRKHPYFHDIMMEKITELIDPTIKHVSLMLSEDGSGRGAALVAASVH